MASLPPLPDVTLGFELEGIYAHCEPTQRKARKQFGKRLSAFLGEKVKVSSDVWDWHPDRWTITPDSSIHPDERFDVDIEVKSPVFTGDRLVEQPANFVAIARAGLQAPPSCGFHMHMGRTGQDLEGPALFRGEHWQPQEVVRFMGLFAENSERITAMADPHRLQSPWARPNNNPEDYETAAIIQKYERTGDHRAAQADLIELYCPAPTTPWTDTNTLDTRHRNYMINLHSWRNKGTLEFRLMQARGYENATPIMGVMAHMAQAAIAGRRFDWNQYAAAVSGQPALALPDIRPQRPAARAPLMLHSLQRK